MSEVWNREQVQEVEGILSATPLCQERVARPSGTCKAPDPDPEKAWAHPGVHRSEVARSLRRSLS